MRTARRKRIPVGSALSMRIASNADGVDYRIRHFANTSLSINAAYSGVPVKNDSLKHQHFKTLTCKASHSLSSGRLMRQTADSTQCACQPKVCDKLLYAPSCALYLPPTMFDRNASNKRIATGDQILSNKHLESRRLASAIDAEQTKAFVVAHNERERVDSLRLVIVQRSLGERRITK